MESESLSSLDSDESDEIELIKDDTFYDDEQRLVLGMLTRNMMFRPIWRNRFAAFTVISGYIIAYSTFARFAHFFDRYGLMFLLPFVVCMMVFGVPLVYLELALGQFTSSSCLLIFKRMVPLSEGLGWSMMMLSYIVLVTDHLPFYTFATVFGNTIQMNRNEMPWHSCSLPYSTEDCQPISPCLSAIIKDTADTFGQSSDYFHELGRYEYGTVVYGGECIRLQAREFDPLRGRSDVKAEYTALNERDSTYSYLYVDRTNQAGLISAPNLVFAYPTPNQYVALFCVLALLVFLSMRGRGFVVKCCFITAGLTYVLMIGFILSVLWTPSHQHHSWLNAKDSLFNPKMWSSALLLHVFTAIDKVHFSDAFVVVVYVVFGALIFAYVHLTLTSSGGLMTAHFNPELFDKLHEAKLAENIYYQMFNWWYAITNMAVYQHYEPYAQFAFSALCMLLAINCTVTLTD
ncbi:unnamed protein product [Nippostrongylus brasiliensis]|uniref:Uncharacterized protein n=1 Tax=Nippostrongylus brasiliensis TaxID=27835 RepID=A0A0N4YPT5_NIPBR|nr:unnamed protein product [Nippostrongylus brasiliensis]